MRTVFLWIISLVLTPLILCAGGPLGVQMIKDTDRNYRWQTVLTFDNENLQIIHDAEWQQLTALARQAYREMIDDIKERNDDPDPEKQVPPGREAYTMTALLVDRKVYLSSPIKGGGYVYRGKTLSKQTPLAQVVQAALLRCRSQYSRELIHKNEGTCGEVMTSQMFCIDQPNEPLNDKGGYAVTWGRYNSEVQTESVINPCGNDLEPGCRHYLAQPEIQVEALYDARDYVPEPYTVRPESKGSGCLA